MVGIDDVMIVDLSTNSQKLLSNSPQSARAVNGNIIRFQWVNDDEVLVNARNGSASSSFMVKSQGE
ncbi:hypothetical protein D3C78_1872190 [compost metagenome]